MSGATARLASTTLLAIMTAFMLPDVAHAAGQFDGNWVIDAPGAGGRMPATGAGAQVCSAFRLPFEIKNNQVVGTLTRSTARPTEIIASRRGTPVKGSVLEDGTFAVQWQNFNIAGKITGDTLVAYWNGQCGPRSATGSRVRQ